MKREQAEKKYAPAVQALADLVAADNCNYQRRSMRECGLFEAGRVALAQVDVDRHRGNNDPIERPELVIAASALLERLDHITTEDFHRGGEREEREALRQILQRMKAGNDGEDER